MLSLEIQEINEAFLNNKAEIYGILYLQGLAIIITP